MKNPWLLAVLNFVFIGLGTLLLGKRPLSGVLLTVGAGVLLGLKLLDHLRYVLAPSRWPLMVSMATGWIPEGYVKAFHPGWYARLSSTEAAAASSTVSPAASTAPRVAGSAGGGTA